MSVERCEWAQVSELETDYHDHEWGVPTHDDRELFELLILEGMQAGLSWDLILRKRQNFVEAFDNFDYQTVASYGEDKIAALLSTSGIVRNKLKVRAAVSNAQAFMSVQDEFGSFDAYLWSFVDGKPIVGNWKAVEDVPCSTPLSDVVSKDLRRRGFKFTGSTIVYSYLQATGLLNDHITSCFKYQQ
ncbi:DNA-3-methyladenine glycosylase [Bombiscardovia apis]|uniref:DNA-3-methyladenine glycosylase n=1 Tax=Bombiscardovia apis TaxID=2932182 RepID=A0ABN6SGC4_9BIFI|nr:DNA-3-methyladenine glycosylase I [Bombiscardovia apis]BDR54528.1 DNA-3-methyladenine glycosylase [Bombiscardovia apis]BDR54553.1 DNA-3-methyladenine glycosylase [Bombiscardovia apis]